jgi:hypothetical protein
MDTHSAMSKDVSLRIRLEKSFRDQLLDVCHATSANILREFKVIYNGIMAIFVKFANKWHSFSVGEA